MTLPFITLATTGSATPYQIPVFPTLPQGWEITKTPKWPGRDMRSVSGLEWRATDQVFPRYEWELTYPLLRDGSYAKHMSGTGDGYDEFHDLAGFFNLFSGGFSPFLYDDPTDNTVVGQRIGLGNGSTTSFQFQRTIGATLPGGGWTDPVYAVNILSAVYINGSPTSAYSIDYLTGVITFTSAPGAGATIAADFTYFWKVRFTQDSMNFENFLVQLWQNRAVKFTSILTPSLFPTPPAPPSPFSSEALAVTPDGSVVVGSSFSAGFSPGPHAFRWTAGGGMVDLGVLSGDTGSAATLVSDDGTVVAGISTDGATIRGFRWTSGGGMVNLGTGGLSGVIIPMAMSADGSVIMGQAGSTKNFRWTAGGGVVSISTLTGTSDTDGHRASSAMSADGSIILEAYHYAAPFISTAYVSVWTSGTGEVNIDTNFTTSTSPGYSDFAGRLSSNGAIGCGTAVRTNPSALAGMLTRWTGLPGSPVQTNLGHLSTYNMFTFGMSAAGDVIAGCMQDPSSGDFQRSFVWTAGTGLVDIGSLGGSSGTGIVTLVGQYGGFVPTFVMQSCISADGSTIVGQSYNAGNVLRAMKWTASGGMVGIGDLGGTNGGDCANAASSNGAIIVGTARVTGNVNVHAFRWSSGSGMVDLGTL